MYVVEGEGVCWQAGSTAAVRAGDVVLVPAGVPHATIPAAGTEMLLFCVFPRADLADNLEELDEVLEI